MISGLIVFKAKQQVNGGRFLYYSLRGVMYCTKTGVSLLRNFILVLNMNNRKHHFVSKCNIVLKINL